MPQRYPADYYELPTGLRAVGLIGSEIELATPGALVASHGAYVEVVALDVLAQQWIGNRDTTSLLDVFSTAIGYKLRWP